MDNRATIFITESEKKHNSKYIYNLVVYKNSFTKVKIICPLHGCFEQHPAKHARGQGCPHCSLYRKKYAGESLSKAIKVHNNKFNYSKTDFSFVKNKTIIICPIHGEFYQALHKHINLKRGCPDCGGSRKKTQEEFLKEAKAIHKELYDYSKSIYSNFESKIIITCRNHGEFLQTPHNHIKGKQGCPRCVYRISKPEVAWLNYMKIPNGSMHRNVLIKLSNRKIKADGYSPDEGIVYEFYGNYYHGNPSFYKTDAINPHCKCTFGELYKRTLEREKSIFESGLKLVYIWEHEWNILNKINNKIVDEAIHIKCEEK